jgi:hypothetical protein
MMQRDFNYEKNNIAHDIYTNESGIKCKNYELCKDVLPKWWFECEGNYLCMNCHMIFGTWDNASSGNNGKGILEFYDNIECPICLECKKGISQPKCEHSICINCFKRCYYRDKSGEPSFPYPDIEDEYFDDTLNPKWDANYPLIRLYNEKWNEWYNNQCEQNDNEDNLKLCPLCRK